MSVVIVAIPEQDDLVWKVSSEKTPHLTLLYLGDTVSPTDAVAIAQFVEHAANTVLTRFWLDVDKRGTLGPDEADVVFFDGWDLPDLKRFRSFLLMNESIAKAHLNATQFPEWLPHLTLGYPTNPASELKDDRIYSVRFDKIAVWFGESTGPEYELKKHNIALEEVAMGADSAVEEVLAHYGVKGMRWGVRKSEVPAGQTKVTQKGKKLKGEGGKGLPAHEDATKAAVSKQKAKGSGLQSLSNQELKDLANRMNLEQQVRQLSTQEKQANSNPASKFIKRTLLTSGKQEAQKASNNAMAKGVANLMKAK